MASVSSQNVSISKCVTSASVRYKHHAPRARLHPHAHLHSLCREIAVELLRFLAMLQMPFLELPSIRIDKRNLLEARVIIQSYNDHCSVPFSRAFWLVQHHHAYSGPGSRHCHGISWNQFH